MKFEAIQLVHIIKGISLRGHTVLIRVSSFTDSELLQTHHDLAVGFLPPPLGLKALHSDDVTLRVVMASLGPKLLLLQFS